MLGVSWSVRLLFVFIALLPGCKGKPAPPAEGWVSNHGLTPLVTQLAAPAVSAEQIPLEAPLETLRVPHSGFSCALDELLAAKCRRCHTVPPRHNAPFPLLTWDDTRGMVGDRPRYLVMASVTKSGYMPYNIAANPPVEPLSDAEKKTIADWVEAGAPKSACPPAPDPQGSNERRVPRVAGSALMAPKAR